MNLKCKCGHEWNYKQRIAGEPRKYTCCPRCRNNVKIVVAEVLKPVDGPEASESEASN